MAENKPSIATLHNLLDYDAQKFISAELQLRNSLPNWITKSTSLKLKNVLQKYLDFIEKHIEKLEDFFAQETISSLSSNNRVMKSLIDEVEEKTAFCIDSEIQDACVLAGVQAINHYKISAYGTAAAFANALSMEKYAVVFHEADINEKQIDDRLSQLAEHEINIKAKTPIVLK